ncbi:Mur ligase family protein [Nocardiopsis sp. Huas11]|uniref:Mur ligase family protein n=1 Tax=Nocardiopsis sp. Huas11 TaxID=2183912 RepID=UPI001EFF2BF5|nr:Mur ligase family protein [Nocardiopsis sp. Huas11]
MGDFARVVPAEHAPTVISVTGPSGKTSTKDLIAQVVEQVGPTVATVGSFNNEIGLRLAGLETTTDTRHLVVEMGARGQGHITYLTRITPPQVGVVLNVDTAHAGEFGGPDMTARAKGELVEVLPTEAEGGVAVLNADDHRVFAMATRTSVRVVAFGLSEDADVYATDVTLDTLGRALFILHTPEGNAPVHLRVVGRPQVSNALAAAAVGFAVVMKTAETAQALSEADAVTGGRLQVTTRPDGVRWPLHHDLGALACLGDLRSRRGRGVGDTCLAQPLALGCHPHQHAPPPVQVHSHDLLTVIPCGPQGPPCP